MANEFGNEGGDNQPSQNPGNEFTGKTSDNDDSQSGIGITLEQLSELQKRDGAAQAHIVELESENKELRTDKAALANDLASSTTLDDVLARMNDKGTGESQTSFDPAKVAELIDKRLQTNTAEALADSNWNSVVDKLTAVYGEWNAANKVIETRAADLRMSTQEASALARSNPSVFFELFLNKDQRNSQQSVNSVALGNTNMSQVLPQEGTRDKAYYTNLRKENPDKYWSVETQKQFRRDIYGTK